MNTLEAILTRRSCREFTEQPIEGEKLYQLLEAAISGPSCVNAQDWSFVVVTDPENWRRWQMSTAARQSRCGRLLRASSSVATLTVLSAL